MSTAAGDPACEQSPLSGFTDRWIPAFRIGVFAVILAHLVLFAIAIPLDYQRRLDEIAASDMAGRLAGSGLTPELFASYLIGITAVGATLYTVLGILILVRRPYDFMPLFVAMVLVIEGTQITGLFYALDSLGAIGRWTADITDAFSSTLLVIFFFIFPTGHFVPRWTRWFAVGVAVFALLGLVLAIRDPLVDYPLLTLLFLTLAFTVMIYAQIHRYRWICSSKERQQVKWVIVGMISALVLFSVAAIATAANPDRGPIAILFWFTLANVGLVMIPLSIAVAILRYQLLDIDRLINRTLVYSTLTLILGGVYTVSVMGLQAVLGFVAGSSGLAVALSTLIAVALFKPIRTRVQESVDRRFFRTRYDASEILGRFSLSIRDEVDLDQVQRVLSQTIDSAIHPSRMSVWMVKPDSRAGVVAPGARSDEHAG